ncbi:MAG: HD domain-containing protein [Syntrophales bacterium]|jgi:(p)ppGpp synthase/HD superfamily hydrolase|nr:HD domain-containing protein [Syntrophales bacterium]
MIFKAIEFATKAHSGQYWKGTKILYVTHPLNVAKTLIQLECSEPVIVAGILHDTLEDTRVTDLWKRDCRSCQKNLVSYVQHLSHTLYQE